MDLQPDNQNVDKLFSNTIYYIDHPDPYQVTFSPARNQLSEIKKWLIAEYKKTGDGFLCNWDNIKYSYEKNELTTISHNNKTIGFATWRCSTEKTARIEIAEVKPTERKKGVGKKLTTELLNFLYTKGIHAVDLKCSPETSELIWKCLGFVEFPTPPEEKYILRAVENKRLYTILSKHLETSPIPHANETIELWNGEPYTTNENTLPAYIWNIEFIDGTRRLSKPIIHPADYNWRLRWKINGSTKKDCQIRRFGTGITFGKFIIIHELQL